MQFFYNSSVNLLVLDAPKGENTRKKFDVSFLLLRLFLWIFFRIRMRIVLQNHFVPYNRVLFTPMNITNFLNAVFVHRFLSSSLTSLFRVVLFLSRSFSNTRLLDRRILKWTQNIELKNKKIRLVCECTGNPENCFYNFILLCLFLKIRRVTTFSV